MTFTIVFNVQKQYYIIIRITHPHNIVTLSHFIIYIILNDLVFSFIIALLLPPRYKYMRSLPRTCSNLFTTVLSLYQIHNIVQYIVYIVFLSCLYFVSNHDFYFCISRPLIYRFNTKTNHHAN